jgi:hypothetical protein
MPERRISVVCGKFLSTFIRINLWTANCPALLFDLAHCIENIHFWYMDMGTVCDFRYRIRNGYTILIQKPEDKRELGRSSRMWEDIRKNLKEMRWVWAAFIWLSRGKVACSCEYSNELSRFIKDGEVHSSFFI